MISITIWISANIPKAKSLSNKATGWIEVSEQSGCYSLASHFVSKANANHAIVHRSRLVQAHLKTCPVLPYIYPDVICVGSPTLTSKDF